MTIIIHYFNFFLMVITIYWEIFASLTFRENGNFNYFTKNIFTNDPRGGIAIFHEF